ncbi:MAG: nucleotidyl transferase AbiEii/AbiGii toxin family protein, partial [Candidatus Omnitrophica bacterium]|nr:nucleotidyl transferase AbiEii/AbiGii toxin family protein [Candidatus Omnitrophota bacterium]
MSEYILAILKKTLDDLAPHGEMDAETLRNALKEVLQFYVLNFIYRHPEYNKWIMYGGSALRIIHGLDRMSVDLDFEVSEMVTKDFLNKLKKEIEDHFSRTYGTHSGFLT